MDLMEKINFLILSHKAANGEYPKEVFLDNESIHEFRHSTNRIPNGDSLQFDFLSDDPFVDRIVVRVKEHTKYPFVPFVK